VAGRVAKPLSFARRFEQDLKRIEAWYLKTADERVADAAVDAVDSIDYRETRGYVKRVVESANVYRALYFDGTSASSMPH